jgi:Fe-S-cluster-containing hydrogenase component 2
MSDAQTLRRRELLFAWRRPAAEPKRVQTATAPRLVAQVQPYSCLGARGQVCTVCAERCPVPGAVRVEGLRVSIAADLCTGCGECRDACPAPGGAIVLWPAPTSATENRGLAR